MFSADLRETLATYYNNDIRKTSSVVFSIPDQEVLGLGLIVLACLPVFEASTVFRGVACLDVSLNDFIIQDLTHFNSNTGTPLYTFLLDKYGESGHSS